MVFHFLLKSHIFMYQTVQVRYSSVPPGSILTLFQTQEPPLPNQSLTNTYQDLRCCGGYSVAGSRQVL